MDTLEMQKMYQKIADKIIEMIPEKWEKVYLYGEIVEGSRRARFFYYPEGSNKEVYYLDIQEMFNISDDSFNKMWYQLLDYLQELQNEFKKNKQEVWTNLTIIMEISGNFKIDYDYENLSNASDYKRDIIWEYKFLGIIPKKERSKKILDEYLKAETK